MTRIPQRGRGFTLIELLVTIALIVVLASLLLPALARAKEQARRVKCISNLKQVAAAAKLFAIDHDGRHPWHTRVGDGGTYGTDAALAWKNFSALSNDMSAPAVLVCPSDRGTKMVAGTFHEFTSPPFQSNALSYFVGLDGYEQLPIAMVAGDRNVAGGKSDTCGSVADSPIVKAREYKPSNPPIRWNNAVHGLSGDIAFADGSVQRANKAELQEMANTAYRYLGSGSILTPNGKKPSNHLLAPK
jgi:prepilin-type N-terminal cleavage/methylation domain-containing protein